MKDILKDKWLHIFKKSMGEKKERRMGYSGLKET